MQNHTQKITIHKLDGTTETQEVLWICANEGHFERVGDEKHRNQGFLIQLGSSDSADNYTEVEDEEKHEMPEIEDIEITEEPEEETADEVSEATESDQLSDEVVYSEIMDVLNE